MLGRTRGIAWIAGCLLFAAGGTGGRTEEPARGDPASAARSRAHYERVLDELRAADTSRLNGGQRAVRAEAIERLRRYCETGNYPVNTDDPESNLPYYRDDAGRRCAVATLLFEMGGEEIVDRMARTDNHAFISSLSGDPAFEAWLDRSGLSLAETVRIMAPAIQGESLGSPASPGESGETVTTTPTTVAPPATPGQPQTPGGAPTPGGPTTGGGNGGVPTGGPPSGGPITGGPTTGSSGGGGPTAGGPPSGGGSGGGPVTGGAPGTPTGGTSRGRTASGGRETRSSLGADAWALWWEFSKTEFYKPNVLTLRGDGAAFTGSASSEQRQRALRSQARREVLPLVEDALGASDPGVRMAAAATLARIQGEAAVPRLVGLLSDASPAVRERALLSLGATGSDAAREVLLPIARTGVHAGESITPSAQGLAVVALAIGTRHGMSPSAEEVRELLAGSVEARDEPLTTAAIFHQEIAPHFRLGNQLHPLHPAASGQPELVRARVAEILPSISNDPKATFEVLQLYLNGRSLEMRRSAAAALGSLSHELVLPQLQTAYELETEPMTRGLMLLSIARQGGPAAKDFLLHELKTGKDREMRPWTALALGLWARESGDEAVRAALRSTTLARADRGARFLALGMSRDTASIPELAEEAAKAQEPWDRVRAAYALALVGTDEARTALRANVWNETSTFVRSLQAFCLGTFGNPEDAPFIVQAARETSDPDLIAPCAVGVRYLGSAEAFELTRLHAADPSVGAVGRAALIEALGMMLDAERPLGVAAVYRRSNIAVLPAWASAALKSTF